MTDEIRALIMVSIGVLFLGWLVFLILLAWGTQ